MWTLCLMKATRDFVLDLMHQYTAYSKHTNAPDLSEVFDMADPEGWSRLPPRS